MDESHSANHQIFVVVLWPLLLVERVCCLDLTTREYNDFRAENQLISRMNCDCSVIDPVLEGNRNARLAIYLPTLRFFSLSKWYFSRLQRFAIRRKAMSGRFAHVTRSFLKCSVARTRSRAHWYWSIGCRQSWILSLEMLPISVCWGKMGVCEGALCLMLKMIKDAGSVRPSQHLFVRVCTNAMCQLIAVS